MLHLAFGMGPFRSQHILMIEGRGGQVGQVFVRDTQLDEAKVRERVHRRARWSKEKGSNYMGCSGHWREVACQIGNCHHIFFVRQCTPRETKEHRQLAAGLGRELPIFVRLLTAEPGVQNFVH